MVLTGSEPPARSRTSDGASTAVGRFALPLYLTAFLFVVTPAIDAITNVWPVQGNPQWRFGFVGSSANYLVSLVFGAVLACVCAAWFGHRRTLRVFAILAALTGLLLIVLLGDFALSAVQFRALVADTNLSSFQMGVAKASLKYVSALVILLITAFAAFRASAIPKASKR